MKLIEDQPFYVWQWVIQNWLTVGPLLLTVFGSIFGLAHANYLAFTRLIGLLAFPLTMIGGWLLFTILGNILLKVAFFGEMIIQYSENEVGPFRYQMSIEDAVSIMYLYANVHWLTFWSVVLFLIWVFVVLAKYLFKPEA